MSVSGPRQLASEKRAYAQWPLGHSQCVLARGAPLRFRCAPAAVFERGLAGVLCTQRRSNSYMTPPGCRAVLLTLVATMVAMDVVRELEWKLPRCCLNSCWRAKSSARGPGNAVPRRGASEPLIASGISREFGRRVSTAHAVPVRLAQKQQCQIRARRADWAAALWRTFAEGAFRSRSPGLSSSRGRIRRRATAQRQVEGEKQTGKRLSRGGAAGGR